MNGLDELGVAGIFFEFLAEPGYVDIDGACSGHRVVAPDGVEEIIAGMHFAAFLDQRVPQ